MTNSWRALQLESYGLNQVFINILNEWPRPRRDGMKAAPLSRKHLTLKGATPIALSRHDRTVVRHLLIPKA